MFITCADPLLSFMMKTLPRYFSGRFGDLALDFTALCCLIAVVATDVHLGLRYSSILEAYDTVPDEVLFLNQIVKLVTWIQAGDWRAVSAFGTPYGYGFLFWFPAALASSVLPQFLLTSLTFFKLVFLALKWGALAGLTWQFRQICGRQAATTYVVLFVACAANFFYGKIFSPEFEVLWLAAMVMGLIIRGANSFKRGASMLALSVAAMSIKMTALPLLVLVIGLLFRYRKDLALRTFARWFMFLLPSALVGAVACIPLMTPDGRANVADWGSINLNREVGWAFAMVWLRMQGITWDLIPLSGLAGFWGGLGAAALGSCALIFNRQTTTGRSFEGAACMLMGLLSGAAIVCTNGYLDWYLWVPLMLIIVGACLLLPSGPPWRMTCALVCLATFLLSVPELWRRVEVRTLVLGQMGLASQLKLPTQALWNASMTACSGRKVVATDFALAVDLSGADADVLHMRDWISLGIPEDLGHGVVRANMMLPPQFFDSAASPTVPAPHQITHLIVNTDLLSKGLGSFGSLTGVRLAKDGSVAHFDGRTFHRVGVVGNRALYQGCAAMPVETTILPVAVGSVRRPS